MANKSIATDDKQGEKPVDTESSQNIDYSKLNIYQKLNHIRDEMYSIGYRKTGDTAKTNSYAKVKFQYFELEDIVPEAIKLCRKVGITPLMVVTAEDYGLKLVNSDNTGEFIIFTFISKDDDKMVAGSSKIQSDGARLTYARRYCWMIALEVTEAEQIDPLTDPDKKAELPKSKEDIKGNPDTPKPYKSKEVTEEMRQNFMKYLYSWTGCHRDDARKIYDAEVEACGGNELALIEACGKEAGLKKHLEKYRKPKTEDDVPVF